MDSKTKIIHHEKFFRLNNLIPTFLLIIAWGIFFLSNKIDVLSIIVYTVIMVIVFVASSRRNSTYIVYENRIELFNFFSGKLVEEIKYEQIDQIRYEDEFNDSYGVFLSNFMIIYPKKGVDLKSQKNGRLALTLTGLNRQPKIIKLLKFFQSKELEVVIKTDSKKIHKETGLKNWNQA
jgi:hypothetical protein